MDFLETAVVWSSCWSWSVLVIVGGFNGVWWTDGDRRSRAGEETRARTLACNAQLETDRSDARIRNKAARYASNPSVYCPRYLLSSESPPPHCNNAESVKSPHACAHPPELHALHISRYSASGSQVMSFASSDCTIIPVSPLRIIGNFALLVGVHGRHVTRRDQSRALRSSRTDASPAPAPEDVCYYFIPEFNVRVCIYIRFNLCRCKYVHII